MNYNKKTVMDVDVSDFEVRRNEYVSLACDFGTRSLLLAYGRHESGVCLQFAVDLEAWVKLLREFRGLDHLIYDFVLCRALGREAQHCHARLGKAGNALCGLCGAHCNLSQL